MKKFFLSFLCSFMMFLLFVPPVSANFSTSITDETHNTVANSQGNDVAVIMENGDLYTWGCNDDGFLGNGTLNPESSRVGGGKSDYFPNKVLSNTVSVSCGYEFVAAIKENGDLYTWGRNDNGQCGTGINTEMYVLSPTKIMSNVASVVCSDSNVAAITKNNDLYVWGDNTWGQIGNGKERCDQSTPLKILSDVVSVSMDGRDGTGAAITKNGDLYRWGNNSSGQIGNGVISEQPVAPVKVLSNVVSVSCGTYYTAAVTKDNELYTWGIMGAKLGLGELEENVLAPTKVMDNVASVVCDVSNTAAITTDGDLYVWGSNGTGSVGNGADTSREYRPVKVLSNIVSVSLDYGYVVALSETGDVYFWGGDEKSKPRKVFSGATYALCTVDGWAAINKDGDFYTEGFVKGDGNGRLNHGESDISVVSGIRQPENVLAVVKLSQDNGTVLEDATGTFNNVVIMSIGANSIIVNNEEVALDVAPFITNGRTMLQFNVLDAFGVDVQWVGETRSVVAEGNGTKVVLTIDSKVAVVNGEEVALDVAPQIVNGRTVVPVGFITGTFGINPEFTYNDDGTIADITFTSAK